MEACISMVFRAHARVGERGGGGGGVPYHSATSSALIPGRPSQNARTRTQAARHVHSNEEAIWLP